jgi:DNA-directed RNA polymerase specialized sigma24 family protein
MTDETPRTRAREQISQLLERLARIDGRQARLVELWDFAGITIDEAAEALGISTAR